MAGSIEDIFLSCSEPKRNVVEPSLVSVGTATMIHCRRCWWWCGVQDVRLKITMHRCDVWTCMSAANACWIVLCKCMLDIKCSVLRGWSCAITKSFEFWLRTVEKMGLILKTRLFRFALMTFQMFPSCHSQRSRTHSLL